VHDELKKYLDELKNDMTKTSFEIKIIDTFDDLMWRKANDFILFD
jgi:uncharacterized protein YnzC (UPF0291/DUF896 family)